MARAKADLPTKICAACGRPFTWRRKWARDWENVRFCSDACRSGRRDRARTEANTSRLDLTRRSD
jgi:hypothetical protein